MSKKFKSCSLFLLSLETKSPSLWHNSTDREQLCNQHSPLHSRTPLTKCTPLVDYEKQENLLLELPLPVIQGAHLSCLEPARYTMEVECMLKPMQSWKSTKKTSNVKIRQDMSQRNTVFKEHERHTHILSGKTLKQSPLLTPWIRFLLQMLIPYLLWNPVTTVFSRTHYWILSWDRWIQSSP